LQSLPSIPFAAVWEGPPPPRNLQFIHYLVVAAVVPEGVVTFITVETKVVDTGGVVPGVIPPTTDGGVTVPVVTAGVVASSDGGSEVPGRATTIAVAAITAITGMPAGAAAAPAVVVATVAVSVWAAGAVARAAITPARAA